MKNTLLCGLRRHVAAFTKRGHVRALQIGLLSAIALATADQAFAQATTTVAPRQQVLASGVLLTNGQALNTNAALANPIPGSQAVGVFTNTLIPFSGSHPIGITCQIINTNVFAASSNLVVTIYPAYDTGGGNPTSLGQRYGTNFSTCPLLTWTIAYTTNLFVSTNLPAATWEPATSLGYVITNTTKSNIVVTLTQSVAP